MKRTGFNSKRPRTERAKRARDDEWIAIAERDGWSCKVCGCSLSDGTKVPEIAHRIASSLNNIARFGLEVVEHPKNKALTCKDHNSRLNIGFNTMAALDLAAEIREELEKGSFSV